MDGEGIELLVGLGNPGADYAGTRHNAGFWFVDRIAERLDGRWRMETRLHGELCRLGLGGRELRALKPMTFMNRSGQAVAATARYFDIAPARILIAYDELDLPVGSARIKRGGGHAGHNGVRDTLAALGSPDFWRLRIGIGHPGDKRQVVSYVLHRPSRLDEDAIHGALDAAEQVLPLLLEGRFQRAMNQLHATPPKDP